MNYQDNIAAMVRPLCLWYQDNRRVLPWRENRDPYRVWVSEIMLQQTRVEAALPYYLRFLEAFPTVYELAEAPEERLLKLWEGLGYYSRVRNMQKAAQIVVEQYGGQFPGDVHALEQLPGIGDYTAGAIASIAFGLPAPAVDGNVLRVIARLCNDEADIMLAATKKRVKEALAAAYRLEKAEAGALTQAIMELGALVCIPGVPRCEACPLQEICQARAAGTEKNLPVRIVNKEKKRTERTVFLICHDGEVALVKRPGKGVLAGMWEFPAFEGYLTLKQAGEFLHAQGIDGTMERFIESRHVFTHLIWDMKSYLVFPKEKSNAFSWFSLEALNGEITLPSAVKPFFKALTEKNENPA